MRFEIINGKVTENTPSNEKKRKENNQERPIEIDNLDYSIPQPPHLPTTEDLLNVLIGKINVNNDKFEFITRHFIPCQTQLPRDLFFDDDF